MKFDQVTARLGRLLQAWIRLTKTGCKKISAYQVEWRNREGKTYRLPMGWILFGMAFLILWVGVFDMLHLKPKPIAPERVWTKAQREGNRVGLDPAFIYAICWAESSLNAHARSGRAKGIMQMTENAWKEVGGGRYARAFSWRRNMRVGVNYLAYCRDFLENSGQFSYPKLAAAFRYGPYKLKSVNFQISELPAPKNRIYRELFQGNLSPVQPPG